jgi:hypothetical protein
MKIRSLLFQFCGAWLTVVFFLFLSNEALCQSAGGSAVLAKCGSFVQFKVDKGCTNVYIQNICKNKSDQARIDIYIDKSKTSEQIPYAQQTFRGGWTRPTIVKIVNIEKGKSGNLCDKRGPGDSDVRVFIPQGATEIISQDLPVANTCDVCGADFTTPAN